MNKKIFSFSFLFLLVFVFGNLFVNSVFALGENTTQQEEGIVGVEEETIPEPEAPETLDPEPQPDPEPESIPEPEPNVTEENEEVAPLPTFNIENALTYLKSTQGADGSFGNSALYTDWAGIALGASNITDSYKDNILAYFASHNTPSSLVTDNERRAMALLSLQQDPYSFNGVNYIDAIISSFDGKQFGDVDFVNDDIFALITLANAGYTADDDIIIKTTSFIISKQKENGSWFSSVDTTAAAIQALKPFESIAGVDESLSRAADYVISKQGDDGSWGSSIFSTSWAIQAMSALDASWTKNGKSGIDYLATRQTNANNNGAMLPPSDNLQNNIWATSYAIAAGSLKPWSKIMQSVSKPEDEDQPVEEPEKENDSKQTLHTSADVSENNNLPTPADPVICPFGHLFSATTGQPCTINTPDSTDSPQGNQEQPEKISKAKQPNTAIMTVPTSDTTLLKNKKIIVSKDLPTNIKEITPDTLTATAVNALPDNNISKTFLIIIGALSGIVLIYFFIKFLNKERTK